MSGGYLWNVNRALYLANTVASFSDRQGAPKSGVHALEAAQWSAARVLY